MYGSIPFITTLVLLDIDSIYLNNVFKTVAGMWDNLSLFFNGNLKRTTPDRVQ